MARLTLWMSSVLVFGLAGCESEGHTEHDVADVSLDTHVAGCSGQDVDDFATSPSKEGEHFTVTVTSASPAVPDVGANAWVVTVEHAGSPTSGLSVVARPWMPAHGHGTSPETFEASPGTAAGAYALGPFNLVMPGFWTLTLTVSDDAGVEEQVVFGVCVEG